MSSYSTARQSSAFSSINTTPLVDVMLVLLIIFMIAAPVFTHRIDFRLPTKTTTPRPDPAQPLQITLGGSAAAPIYLLDGVRMDPSELVRRLRSALDDDPALGFVLNAAPNLGYEQVSKAMVLLRHGGLTRGSFEVAAH